MRKANENVVAKRGRDGHKEREGKRELRSSHISFVPGDDVHLFTELPSWLWEVGVILPFYRQKPWDSETPQGLLLVSAGASMQILVCWAPNPVLLLFHQTVLPASGNTRNQKWTTVTIKNSPPHFKPGRSGWAVHASRKSGSCSSSST